MTAFLPPTDFPATRLRRNRRDDFSRRLVRETRLSTDDLIYPVVVCEGQDTHQPVTSMPGVERQSPDVLLRTAEQCLELGIPVMALFPTIDPSLKTPDGIEAANPDGLIPRTIALLKSHFPELGVLTDVALDPYTSHGQDGLLDGDGQLLNEPTEPMRPSNMSLGAMMSAPAWAWARAWRTSMATVGSFSNWPSPSSRPSWPWLV